MKHLKMLGLAVVAAAALTAFMASSASATVLCKAAPNESNVCTGGTYGSGTEIKGELEGTAKLKAGFAVIECSASTVSGTTSNAGGAGEEVKGAISAESFTSCKEGQTVTVNSKGELSIAATSGGNGTISVSSGNSVTVKVGTTECTYGKTIAGKGIAANGGSPAHAVATETTTELEKTAGGILCASPAKWIATYKVAAPSSVWVAAS